MVLLCYESKVNPVIQEKKKEADRNPYNQGVEPYFQTQTRGVEEFKKKKRKKSDDCALM